MRLRRLEIVIVAVTLAFVCFMGGFFTGRSRSAVGTVSVAAQNTQTQAPAEVSKPQETNSENNRASSTEAQPSDILPNETSLQASANPAPDESPEAPGQQRSGDGKININLASQSELTDLPGIGSVLAARIVDYRRQHGNFQRIEDLRNVSGIGEKRYETIQDKITVG